MHALVFTLALIGWTFFPQPPPAMRGPASAVVYFVPRGQVETLCKHNTQDRVIACTNAANGVVVLPNPCDWPVSGDAYAELMCHELGHLHDWRH